MYIDGYQSFGQAGQVLSMKLLSRAPGSPLLSVADKSLALGIPLWLGDKQP